MEIVGIIIISICLLIIWLISKPEKEVCHTSIFCTCGNDMCLDNSFISDTCDENGDNHVRYKCEKCGKGYDYNFDIAPVPISWSDIK